jgi:hypothetical protein
MLIGSIVALFLAAIFFLGFFLLPSLATAQQEQTTTTTTPPSSSLSITTPPLTPQEQEQQNRLQNVIAATTANLNETEKQVSGIVFTPRWSEPVWINANSVSVLIAYCLPGEFADSGQEILGGFELEVLESYAVALPQGFMAWMAIVGNQDEENIRLPAAVGVICASDLNDAEARILSPQEQQQINNINQQFTTIQNTQITNIDQVINIINNVTTPRNDTGGVTEQSFTVEIIISNAVEGPTYTEFLLESKVTGGTEPYTYDWGNSTRLPSLPDNMLQVTVSPGATLIVPVTVTDSNNQTASDSIQLPPTNDTGGGTPPIECPLGSFYNSTSGQCEFRFPDVIGNATIKDTTPPRIDGLSSATFTTSDPEGMSLAYGAVATDDVDGIARLDIYNNLIQDDVGGDIAFSCSPPARSVFPIGVTTIQCAAVDASSNVGTLSATFTIELVTERGLAPEPTPTPSPEPQPEPTPTPEPEPEPEPGDGDGDDGGRGEEEA